MYSFQDGYTALHIAAIGGHTSMIKTLLAHRADLFIKDKVWLFTDVLRSHYMHVGRII